MKSTKIILSGLVALAATANAMPTPEETKKVEPLVMDLMRADQAALKSGKKTRVEVAQSAMELADKAESEAAKLLLMKGAFNFYVRAGEFDKAIETLQALQTAIPDMPPVSMVNIIEASLRVVSRKNGGQLYQLLGEMKTRMRYADELKTLENSVKNNSADRALRLKLAEHYAYLGNWDSALENFAAVDGKIGEIAKAERNGEGANKKVADFWWDYPKNYAKGKADEIEKCFRARAAKLYEDAIAAGDIKGLNQVQAERRIEESKGSGAYVLEPTSAKKNDSADAAPNVEYKFTYKLNDGKATITGIDPKPVGTVVIPDKIDGHLVTEIEGYNERSPFWGCDKVTRVVLPAGLEEGRAGAFMSCKSLSSIEVSRSNKKFASRDGALYSKDFSTLFIYPKTRDSIKLSPKTRKVSACAFRGCALKTAKIPEGIVEVDSWNLCECPDLELIEFPKSLKHLGPCAAHGNDKLKKIVFNGDAPQAGLAQFSWGTQFVFTGAPEDLVVEVRKGTKGWKSPVSRELPERWPTNQKESRPIRYIK